MYIKWYATCTTQLLHRLYFILLYRSSEDFIHPVKCCYFLSIAPWPFDENVYFANCISATKDKGHKISIRDTICVVIPSSGRACRTSATQTNIPCCGEPSVCIFYSIVTFVMCVLLGERQYTRRGALIGNFRY